MGNLGVILSTSGVPHVDEHVLRELKNFDPHIKLTFSEYRISKRTGEILESQYTGNPFYHPRWHVWYVNPTEGAMFHMFTVEDANGDFTPVDGRVLYRIKSDLMRQGFNPDDVARQALEAEVSRKAKKEKKADDLIDDFFAANKKLISDNVEGTKNVKFHDSPKIMSYPGQENRGTKFHESPVSNKDLGLEVPDWNKELE